MGIGAEHHAAGVPGARAARSSARAAAVRLVGALEQRRELAVHVGRPGPAGAYHRGAAQRSRPLRPCLFLPPQSTQRRRGRRVP